MCGRLTHTLTPEDYATYVDLVVPPLEPNLDVRPTDTLPIVRMGERGLEYALAKWGFPTKSNKVLFNARSETVAKLPSFREAYRKRRALLLVSGWYEWVEGQRYLIRRKDGKPVVMAALWCAEAYGDRFTILTTTPTDDVAQYHHRMPVVLLKRDWDGWLGGTTQGFNPFPQGVFVGIAGKTSLESKEKTPEPPVYWASFLEKV